MKRPADESSSSLEAGSVWLGLEDEPVFVVPVRFPEAVAVETRVDWEAAAVALLVAVVDSSSSSSLTSESMENWPV